MRCYCLYVCVAESVVSFISPTTHQGAQIYLEETALLQRPCIVLLIAHASNLIFNTCYTLNYDFLNTSFYVIRNLFS